MLLVLLCMTCSQVVRKVLKVFEEEGRRRRTVQVSKHSHTTHATRSFEESKRNTVWYASNIIQMRLYFIQNTASSLSQSFKFLSHDPRGTFYDDSNNNTDNGSEWMIYHDANHIIIQSVYSLCNITRPSKFWEKEQECITLKIPSNRCLSEFCAQHGQILCLDRRAMKGALGVMWKRRWSKWHYITLVLQMLRKYRRLPWTATVRTQHGKQGKWTSDLLFQENFPVQRHWTENLCIRTCSKCFSQNTSGITSTSWQRTRQGTESSMLCNRNCLNLIAIMQLCIYFHAFFSTHLSDELQLSQARLKNEHKRCTRAPKTARKGMYL